MGNGSRVFPVDKHLPRGIAHKRPRHKGTKPSAHMSDTTKKTMFESDARDVSSAQRNLAKRQHNNLEGRSTMSEANVFKACPFCGSGNLKFGTRDRVKYVDCTDCRVTFDFWHTIRDESVKVEDLWNRRAGQEKQPTPPPDETLSNSYVSGWMCDNCGHPRHPRERCKRKSTAMVYTAAGLQQSYHCPCGIQHEKLR